MNVICTDKEAKLFEDHARRLAGGTDRQRSAWARAILHESVRFEQTTGEDASRALALLADAFIALHSGSGEVSDIAAKLLEKLFIPLR